MALGNAKNIIVGAAPLYLTVDDSTDTGYTENLLDIPSGGVSFTAGSSATATLDASNKVRNVGFTNNGLQITYNPTYDSVTVDQLLDTAKLFKSAMEVMIATELSEGTLENVVAVFGQKSADSDTNTTVTAAKTLTKPLDGTTVKTQTMGLAGGALLEAPTERQLFAVGPAPTAVSSATERVYYARRVLSVQQSQFSLARNTPTTFPVTFRLLPDVNYSGSEYGKIIDRITTA